MSRKTVSGLMAALLLVSMLAIACNIPAAKKSETLCIRADMSADPLTAQISISDTYMRAVLSNLTLGDEEKLTQLLQILSVEWNDTAVNQANVILSNKIYGSSAWRLFFEGYFVSNPLTDSLHFYLCHPLFYWFDEVVHSNLQEGIMSSLFNNINTIMETYSANLSLTLSNHPTILQTLAKSHGLLDQICTIGVVNDANHIQTYDFYRNLTSQYPQLLKSNVTFNIEQEPYLATLRAQAYATFEDALPLSNEVKEEIAESIGLYGLHLEIWNDFGAIVADNNGLSQNQMMGIQNTFQSIPQGIHNLKMITQNDLLGNVDERYFWIYSSAIINLLNVEVGAYSENQFPDDISPQYSDFFHMILVHEINHIVDASYISSNSTLYSRKLSLIEDAGTNHMNYLRSMLPDGFFTQSPQEFFASISNQWFCDSFHTLELGLARLDSGYPEPINQFLLFADVLSRGLNTTVFYRLDESGNITVTPVGLTRAFNGQISSLEFNDTKYYFNVDCLGSIVPQNNVTWIMSDGSINPQTTHVLSTDNKTYTIIDDFTGSIIVDRDNVTVDGTGHTISGPAAKWGICVWGAKNVEIRNTSITSFKYGILLDSSLHSNVSANTVANNRYGFGIYSRATNNSLFENTITSNEDGIRLWNCRGTIVRRNWVSNNTYGIQFFEIFEQNTISDNNITANSKYGIVLSDCSSSIISGNNISRNSLDGILLKSSSSNTIDENIIDANSWYGVRLLESDDNVISRNNVTYNGAHGILLDGSCYNSLTDNQIIGNNYYGMYFWHYSNYNSISGNTVMNNDYVIWLLESSYNLFHHNSFVNNDYQVLVYPLGETNFWDDGYPSGGNYWSNYAGADIFWDSSQNKTGSDGIGDTPSIIDENNRDNYPLMSPSEYWSNPIGGDVNKDRKVDGRDIALLAKYFGSTSGYPPNVDINGDGKIDGRDIALAARNFGQTYP